MFTSIPPKDIVGNLYVHVMVSPFYRYCNSHENGAAQAHIEKGKNEVLEDKTLLKIKLSLSIISRDEQGKSGNMLKSNLF